MSHLLLLPIQKIKFFWKGFLKRFIKQKKWQILSWLILMLEDNIIHLQVSIPDFTPDVGFFLDNVLAEFGIVLHSYWDESTKRLIKLTFNVTRCMIGEDGITRVVEVSELYNRLTNKSERERLMIDNESVVNRFAGWAKSFEPYKEYVIF